MKIFNFRKMRNKISKFMTAFFLVFLPMTLLGVQLYSGAFEEPVRVPVLLYHHINEIYEPDIALVNLTPEEFRLHMQTLKAYDYNPITFYDFYEHVTNNIPLPEKPIIISFDDGYTSNYTEAYPILKELNIPATIFIVTETVGRRKGDGVNYPHFTWEEAREMQESGIIDIQSHTNGHRDVAKLDKYNQEIEIRRSKYLIETNLNKPCDILAYPFGSYTDGTIEIARSAGYKMQALVGDFGTNKREDGVDRIRRLTVSGHMSNKELIEMIEKNLSED